MNRIYSIMTALYSNCPATGRWYRTPRQIVHDVRQLVRCSDDEIIKAIALASERGLLIATAVDGQAIWQIAAEFQAEPNTPDISNWRVWVDRELVLDLEKRVTELERRAVRRSK